MRIAVGESQILFFRFGVEGQEEEMGMTRKFSKSPHSIHRQNVPFFTAYAISDSSFLKYRITGEI